MKPKTTPNKIDEYYCIFCDYLTTRKYNMQKHIANSKHQIKQTEYNVFIHEHKLPHDDSKAVELYCVENHKTEKQAMKNSSKRQGLTCRWCFKLLKSKTTRWRHENSCSSNETVTKIHFKSLQADNAELKAINTQLLKAVTDLAPKVGNNNVNIQVFLNEECKDAMNLVDFAESIPLTLMDLDYTCKNGKLEGVSNVIIKELEVLDKKERPLHCNKNKTIYVKDKDEWHEDVNNSKIKSTIESVENDYLKLIEEWEISNDGWMDDDTLRTEYLELVKTVLPNLQDKEKRQIINKISKIIKI